MNTSTDVVVEPTPVERASVVIEVLRDMDVPDAAIRVALSKKGFDDEVIAELLPKVKRVSFASSFYAFLVEAPRTEAEIAAMITDPANSDNIKVANLKHYSNIGKLVSDVRAKIESDAAELEAELAALEAELED
jgi:hypothetical protein